MPSKRESTESAEQAAAPSKTPPGFNDHPGFYDPVAGVWQKLEPADGLNGEEAQREINKAKANEDDLQDFLLSSLQMQHVVVLAGSGTSLGSVIQGPSMKDLWNFCVPPSPERGDVNQDENDKAQEVLQTVNFAAAIESDSRNKDNIEALLSRCETYLQLNDCKEVSDFVQVSKKKILDKCRGFLRADCDGQLDAHRTFLHRLSRRRVRDSRLKLFTTNYDVCFERAAGNQGLVCLDGFSFSQPRRFDPRFFSYDIVRRSPNADDFGTPLEGVFQLYKLHGSVNWERSGNGAIVCAEKPAPESVCMIFPAAGKYQQSYIQPHLELISQYLSALREPNTCVIAIGYGFNDDHLSEPILAATQTNPRLRLVVVTPTVERDVSNSSHQYWSGLFRLAKQGHDIRLINATFQKFAEMIPDLKSLTPAERLTKDIRDIASS